MLASFSKKYEKQTELNEFTLLTQYKKHNAPKISFNSTDISGLILDAVEDTSLPDHDFNKPKRAGFLRLNSTHNGKVEEFQVSENQDNSLTSVASSFNDSQTSHNPMQSNELYISSILNKNKKTGNFQCFECKLSFKYKSSLQEHSKKHLIKKNSALECQQCKRRFKYLASLNKHLQMHSQKNQDDRNAFFKKYFQNNNPVQKIGRKIHVCNYCSKRFIHSANLIYHLRIHEMAQ